MPALLLYSALAPVTATVRNYEILQLTVPYTRYVFFTAFWLLFPSFTVSFREREGRLFTSMGFYGLKLFTRSPCLRWVLAGHDGEKPLSPRQSMQGWATPACMADV